MKKDKKKVKVVYIEDKGETIYSMAALNGRTPEEQEEFDKQRKNRVRPTGKERFAMISAAFSVYGACARMGPRPFAAAYAPKAFASALSTGLAAPPRGLRVKNWKTFAPMETAVWPMAR